MLQVHKRWTSTLVPHDFASFFFCKIEKFIVCCISAKKNYCNLTKDTDKFQASVTERYTSLNKRYGIYFFSIWVFFHEHFMIHRTAGEGGGYLFNSSLTLPPVSQTLRYISRAITANSSPVHIADSRTWTGNLWFLSASR